LSMRRRLPLRRLRMRLERLRRLRWLRLLLALGTLRRLLRPQRFRTILTDADRCGRLDERRAGQLRLVRAVRTRESDRA
jgi:hypothetical protein